MSVDYSLYLVTDSTPQILGNQDLGVVVEEAILGGVTVVQYREKSLDSRRLLETARRLRQVTARHGVPFIVNDRIDIALAVGADGVHVGQSDIDLSTARTLLGPKAIIGVTCSSVDHVRDAVKSGADYLGVGTVYATATKPDATNVIGTAGVRDILAAVDVESKSINRKIAVVAIGGLNAENVVSVMHDSSLNARSLDGVAVVSTIIAAVNPTKAAQHLNGLIRQTLQSTGSKTQSEQMKVTQVLQVIPSIIARLPSKGPVSHNMINNVVINFAANVALAIGAKPIMSLNIDEVDDVAGFASSLTVNMGTADPTSTACFIAGLQAYNRRAKPVLLDPVGAGATKIRRATVSKLLQAGHFSAIKGNEAEIITLLGEEQVQQQGVDSSDTGNSEHAKGLITKKVAAREHSVVIMTGRTDIISDGQQTFVVHNGHRVLGQVTGTGCSLGVTIASCLAMEPQNHLLAALSGMLLYNIAAEKAARLDCVGGPGSFIPAFVDQLASLVQRTVNGDSNWLSSARLEQLEV